MTISDTTSAFAVSDLQYYSYGARTANNNYYTLVNGWLRLYACPTASGSRRTVSIPNVPQYTGSDGVPYKFTDKNYWYAFENYESSKINPDAIDYLISINKPVVINTGEAGQYTNENGRYWMAVGPNVVNPNHQANQMPYPQNMYGKGVLDVVVKDSNGKKYYIPAVVGDVKGHTWTNGVIQTWKKFPNGVYASAKNFGLPGNEYNGTVAVEFIGDFDPDTWSNGLEKYSIDSIIFYPN